MLGYKDTSAYRALKPLMFHKKGKNIIIIHIGKDVKYRVYGTSSEIKKPKTYQASKDPSALGLTTPVLKDLNARTHTIKNCTTD